MNQISKMIHSNSKYLTVPHGIPDHLKQRNSDPITDRNRIYAKRSSNPIVIPTNITDIPV